MLEIGIGISVVVLVAAYLFKKGHVFVRAQFAARRMCIRDKGPNPRWMCSLCHTGSRVGIRKVGGTRVDYCWRCEAVLSTTEPDPGAEEDVPVETPHTEPIGVGQCVVSLDRHPNFKQHREF